MAQKSEKRNLTTERTVAPQRALLPKEWQEVVREAAKVIQSGGVILYPTDTIWGIGCDATNEDAVKRVFEIKERPSNKSMLLLLDNEAKLPWLVKEVPSMAYDLIECAVHPLTIIYPGARHVAPQLISEEGTIGIRITEEAFSKSLCKAIGVPLVSTSANLSGQPSPRYFAEINPEVIARVDYVVPVRQDETIPHTPSEIIKLGIHNEVEIIRAI